MLSFQIILLVRCIRSNPDSDLSKVSDVLVQRGALDYEVNQHLDDGFKVHNATTRVYHWNSFTDAFCCFDWNEEFMVGKKLQLPSIKEGLTERGMVEPVTLDRDSFLQAQVSTFISWQAFLLRWKFSLAWLVFLYKVFGRALGVVCWRWNWVSHHGTLPQLSGFEHIICGTYAPIYPA